MATELTPSELKARLEALGLFGLIACCDEIIDKPWLREVLAIEERERQKRGLERRTRDAHVGAAKPMADFDWAWPKKIEELFTRRYDAGKPVLLSTNKAFSEWNEVFPQAACVVTLVDRLIHRAEVIDIEADGYRLEEAKELTAARANRRSKCRASRRGRRTHPRKAEGRRRKA